MRFIYMAGAVCLVIVLVPLGYEMFT